KCDNSIYMLTTNSWNNERYKNGQYHACYPPKKFTATLWALVVIISHVPHPYENSNRNPRRIVIPRGLNTKGRNRDNVGRVGPLALALLRSRSPLPYPSSHSLAAPAARSHSTHPPSAGSA